MVDAQARHFALAGVQAVGGQGAARQARLAVSVVALLGDDIAVGIRDQAGRAEAVAQSKSSNTSIRISLTRFRFASLVKNASQPSTSAVANWRASGRRTLKRARISAARLATGASMGRVSKKALFKSRSNGWV